MKPRNKEVNIFNMSLLDILCGALGAFCFLMLVLFQYWKPEGPDVTRAKENSAKQEQQVRELLRRMSQMSDLSPEAASQLRRIEQQFQKLQAETQQLRGMLQKAQGQAQSYQRQMQQAQAQVNEQKKQINKLQSRNPVTVVMQVSSAEHDVDLYVQDSKMDPPQPDKAQGRRWSGDVFYNPSKGPASDVWMMRDAPPQEYKIYYKFLGRNGNPSPARITGYVMNNNRYLPLPQLDLPDDRRVYYAGSFVVNPDYSSTFRPAPEYAAGYRETLQAWKITPELLTAPGQ